MKKEEADAFPKDWDEMEVVKPLRLFPIEWNLNKKTILDWINH